MRIQLRTFSIDTNGRMVVDGKERQTVIVKSDDSTVLIPEAIFRVLAMAYLGARDELYR